jgi:aminotransferase
VTTGSSGAFFAAGMTLLEPGDEVVLFEPYYSYHWQHRAAVRCGAGGRAARSADARIRRQALRRALTKRTRAVVVNTPGNPSGKVWSARKNSTLLAGVLDGSDVLVLTDEVYEYMCFDGRKHVSPASVPGLAERTLTMNSFSKTFSVTGWRIGFLAGPVGDRREVRHRVRPDRGVRRAADAARCAESARAAARQLLPRPAKRATRRSATRSVRRCATPGSRSRCRKAPTTCSPTTPVFGDLEPYPAVLKMIERIGVNAVPGHLFFARPEGCAACGSSSPSTGRCSRKR